MGEFDIIREVFAPLSRNAPGAADLTDDVALVGGGPYVFTKDAIIAGVHFLPKDPLDLVARKLVRVNLSDLAAKGVKPVGYFLACVWPATTNRSAIEAFADGLQEDQERFGIALYGGDTTKHRTKSAPLILTATFFGTPPRAGLTRRSGAQVGDDIYVTGAIGDAGLGLRALTREEKFTTVDKASLALRYHLPEPRLLMGAAIAGLATSTIDVSDGLIADVSRLAAASGVEARIDAVSIPRSAAAGAWVARQDNRWKALCSLASFGDDYEIAFTAAPTMRRSVAVAAKAARTDVTRIGVISKGEGIKFLDESGRNIPAHTMGFDHFEA